MKSGLIIVLFTLGTLICVTYAAPASSEIEQEDDPTNVKELLELLESAAKSQQEDGDGDDDSAEVQRFGRFFKSLARKGRGFWRKNGRGIMKGFGRFAGGALSGYMNGGYGGGYDPYGYKAQERVVELQEGDDIGEELAESESDTKKAVQLLKEIAMLQQEFDSSNTQEDDDSVKAQFLGKLFKGIVKGIGKIFGNGGVGNIIKNVAGGLLGGGGGGGYGGGYGGRYPPNSRPSGYGGGYEAAKLQEKTSENLNELSEQQEADGDDLAEIESMREIVELLKDVAKLQQDNGDTEGENSLAEMEQTILVPVEEGRLAKEEQDGDDEDDAEVQRRHRRRIRRRRKGGRGRKCRRGRGRGRRCGRRRPHGPSPWGGLISTLGNLVGNFLGQSRGGYSPYGPPGMGGPPRMGGPPWPGMGGPPSLYGMGGPGYQPGTLIPGAGQYEDKAAMARVLNAEQNDNNGEQLSDNARAQLSTILRSYLD